MYRLFTIVFLCCIIPRTIHAQEWSLEAITALNVDRLEPEYESGNYMSTAIFLSPGIRVVKKLNNKLDVYVEASYFDKIQNATTLYDHTILFDRDFFLMYLISSKQNQYKGFKLNIGLRYNFIEKKNWKFYGIVALTDNIRFYAKYNPTTSYEPIAYDYKWRQLGLGVEVGSGLKYHFNKRFGILFELNIKPLEYQHEPALMNRNGFKGFSQANCSLGLAYSL